MRSEQINRLVSANSVLEITLTNNTMKKVFTIISMLLCLQLSARESRHKVSYILQEEGNINADPQEAAKIQNLAVVKGWGSDNANEWNYVYNKVAFVGWYETAKQFLAAPDVDDDEKAACEWAMRQGATYIPATSIIDFGCDLSMFDAFWINIDFDESALGQLKEYYNTPGKYTDAEKALLDYDGVAFSDIAFPEEGVHIITENNTSESDYEKINRILRAHTAGMTDADKGLRGVGVANSLVGDRFIKALKLRHQLGWNLLLTNHASFLISYIDRYSFDTTGNKKNDRLPRRWNFKNGAMVDREGYAVKLNKDNNGFETVRGEASVAYGHYASLWSNGFYQDWPGTIDMTRVGVDYARLNNLLEGGQDEAIDLPGYLTEATRQNMSQIGFHNTVSDDNYLNWFARFFHEKYFTRSQQNINVYRGIDFNVSNGVKADGDYPDHTYAKTDEWDPKFLKTFTLFAGAETHDTGETYQTGDPVYHKWVSGNMENHNAYFAIDRVRRSDPDHDNTEPEKWRDLYIQSAMEPLATRPDITDYCMATMIRWYPTDQSWRSNSKDNDIVLPGDLSNVHADKLESFKGRAFTLSMPGYEWNPGQEFHTWYDGEMVDDNNGYDKPFDPARYLDKATARPADSREPQTALDLTGGLFDRGNIEQLTHNVLYELVRQTRETAAETQDLSPIAYASQLLIVTPEGRGKLPAAYFDDPDAEYFLTFRNPDDLNMDGAVSADLSNRYFLISPRDEGRRNVIKEVTAADIDGYETVDGFIADQENVIWTSDFYVRAYSGKKFDEQAYEGFSLIVATEGTGYNRDDVVTVRSELSDDEIVYGAVMGRVGNLRSGVFNSKLSYRKPDGSTRKANATVIFSPVMPKPYAGTYEHSYDQPDQTLEYDTPWLQFTVPSTARPGDNCDVLLATEKLNPRQLDCALMFRRPNVSQNILRNYDIHYDIEIVSRHADGGSVVVKEVSGMYYDLEEESSSDLYRFVVKNVSPESDVYPEMRIVKTEYYKSTNEEYNAVVKATYGPDVDVEASNGLSKRETSIDKVYLRLFRPGDTDETGYVNETDLYQWRYLGHTEYKQSNLDLDGIKQNLIPNYFLVETLGSGNDYSYYPVLTEHVIGHQKSAAMDGNGLFSDDDDPLIGSFIAHGFESPDEPEVHVTPIFIFDHNIVNNTDITDTSVYTSLIYQGHPKSAPSRGKKAAANGMNSKIPYRIDSWYQPGVDEVSVPDADKFVVVTGIPVNSTSIPVSSVDGIQAHEVVKSVNYYSVNGVAVAKPMAAGVYVKVVERADGSKTTRKVVVK